MIVLTGGRSSIDPGSLLHSLFGAKYYATFAVFMATTRASGGHEIHHRRVQLLVDNVTLVAVL